MDPINLLSTMFKEFPGIGERQAKRFVYFLLHKNPQYVKSLGDAILSIKNQIKQCTECYLFFQSTNNSVCETCRHKETDHTTLLVVEKDADFESIKRSRTYKGMYFILGGLVPVVTKETPNFVRTKELINTIEKRAKDDGLKEVILGLSINPQGEHTDMYLRELINPLKDKYYIKISTLGRGLSTGTELEYSDSETIKNALRNRN
ncbi:recombination protein RecR [Candidatus Nomurabacteria bacterium]|nr:recombination protein RecR [Candidatus Nomurabacteria bacterium]